MIIIPKSDLFICAHIHTYLQLVQDCLHQMVVMGDDFALLDGHVTLVHRIAAVHVVYRTNHEYIHWFGQLTSHSPEILPSLEQPTVDEDEDMVGGYEMRIFKLR